MINSPFVRVATIADAVWLAGRLRPEDEQEIHDISGMTPLKAVAHGLFHSRHCFVILSPSTGNPIAIMGVVPDDPVIASGRVWMHGTPEIRSVTKSFLKYSRPVLQQLHQHYDVLYNIVDARNTVHVNWLRWIGCVFINRIEEIGVGGIDAYTFVSLRRH